MGLFTSSLRGLALGFAEGLRTNPTESKAGARPLRARTFAAAKTTNLTADWRTDNLPINKDLRVALKKLRERSRDMVKNSPFGARFINLIRTNVVGFRGVQMQSKPLEADGTLDKAASDMIEAAWKRWGRKGECEASRTQSWRQAQSLMALTLAIDGEYLGRFLDNFPNAAGFAIEHIDVDLLDMMKNQERTKTQNEIVMGIEYDAFGAAVKFHFRSNSGSYPMTWDYPASDIIHVFDPIFVRQGRGFPKMTAAMMSLRQLEAYEDAEIVAARVGASSMAVETIDPESDFEGDQDPETGDETAAMSPGEWRRLQKGRSVTPLNFNHPPVAFGEFIRRQLERMAAALGFSYASYSGDMSNTNYSSIRWGGLDEREYFKVLQEDMIEGFHSPIFTRWLKVQIFSGRLNLPAAKFEKFDTPVWMPRRWAWVDPKNEIEATVMALENRLTTPSKVAADQGMDFEELLEQYKLDAEIARKAGISLPFMDPKPKGQVNNVPPVSK